MPELPEVESLVRFLRQRAVGQAVADIQVSAVSVLKTYDPPLSALAGSLCTDVLRRGKFLDLDIDGLHLIIHLARAGWLRWTDPISTSALRPGGKSPIAFRVRFGDGAGFDLTEAGTRKGLAVYLVRDPAQVPGVARLGIDVLSAAFTEQALAELLKAAGSARLKGVLTDQTVLAGVGNAYSDEVLWAVGMSPFTPASSVRPEQVAALHKALTRLLNEAIQRSAGLAANSLKAEKKAGLAVHGRTNLPCPRCGGNIREIAFADKSWQYCPTCQTGGKVLADRRLSRLLK
ncbi:MAG TPA: DNA-formamidopyrimidine glycosylase family protein [Mycobacteriales bacterium]|jgi:formamidopyrimidine-DNA glycosylase|nr:DNA-formamidopyrimidine glycosylase family protein [Mycobacteriales bacterium]